MLSQIQHYRQNYHLFTHKPYAWSKSSLTSRWADAAQSAGAAAVPKGLLWYPKHTSQPQEKGTYIWFSGKESSPTMRLLNSASFWLAQNQEPPCWVVRSNMGLLIHPRGVELSWSCPPSCLAPSAVMPAPCPLPSLFLFPHPWTPPPHTPLTSTQQLGDCWVAERWCYPNKPMCWTQDWAHSFLT